MLNDICIDIDFSQIYKHGQNIGGDVFLIDRSEGSNILTATLSDGLGSGVKANVLASMTSHMASKMSFSPLELGHSAEIIMDTLPVDKEKGISYSTFTIAKVVFSEDKSFINVDLVEYDNPDSLRFRGSEALDWEKEETKLQRKSAVKDETILTSSFSMSEGDRLIFFSDGVAQSGVSLGNLPSDKEREPVYYGGAVLHKHAAIKAAIESEKEKEWGSENVKTFVADILRRQPEIDSRSLSRAIVTEAYKRDNYHSNDDITCAVVAIRKPKRTLIVTGAPRNKSSDKRLAEIVKNYEGKTIVCGGTTSKIIARELGKDIKADRSPSGNLPPAALLEGVDLVTEGMLTLSEVAKRLENKTLLKDMPEDPAKRIISILRESDQFEIIVGTKINDETDDPTTAAQIGVRFPVVDRIRNALERKYFKEVEVKYY